MRRATRIVDRIAHPAQRRTGFGVRPVIGSGRGILNDPARTGSARARIVIAAFAASILLGANPLGAAVATAAQPAHGAAASEHAHTASAAGTADPTSTPTPTSTPERRAARRSAEVTVTAGDAGIIQSGHPVTFTVTVTNTGTTALPAGVASVWFDSAPIGDRGDLDTWLRSTGEPDGAIAVGQASTTAIEPGSQTVAIVTAAPTSLGIAAYTQSRTFGIGATFGARSVSATTRGQMVWNAGITGAESSVAVAMPITAPASTTGLISAADLASYTAPTGVLSRELDGVMGHPEVALGIDPMIIASIRVLGANAPASAEEWLRSLAALPNDIFPLQYGDADVTAQLQAGDTSPLQPTSLEFGLQGYRSTQTSVGEPTATPTPTRTAGAGSSATPSPTATSQPGPVLPTLQELTAWTYTMSGIAWPAPDTVRSSDLTALATAGLTTTIVSSSNTSETTASTPNALMTFSGGKAAIADSTLSTALQDASTATNDAQWQVSMSRANAVLQLISAQNDSGSHTLFIALGRSAPSSYSQLDRTLSDIETSPWANEVPFGQILSADVASGVSIKDMSVDSSRLKEIQALRASDTAVDSFASVLQTPVLLTGQVRARELALLGVGWMSEPTAWNTAVGKVLESNSRTVGSVRVLHSQNVNVVSSQGSIPFTVSNTLSDQGISVYLQALPSNNRLEISNSVQKVVAADSRATVLVPVKARLGNGQVTLRLQLFSSTGVPIGPPTSVRVEVHADWEGIGAAIVGSALVLLFGFGIVRGILRRRRPLTDAAPDGPDDDE